MLLQRLDEQEVQREPHRPAPVGIAAEEPAVRLARRVGDAMHLALEIQLKGIVGVVPRERADAVRREKLVFIEDIAEHALESLA